MQALGPAAFLLAAYATTRFLRRQTKPRVELEAPVFPAAAAINEDLAGKVAIVTGASSGIGAEIAILLSSRGSTVALVCGSNRAGAEDTLSKCAGTAAIFQSDFCSKNGAADLIKSIVAKFGRIDILVNNAGVFEECPFETDAPLQAFEDNWRRTFSVNVDAAAALSFLVAQHIASRVKALTEAAGTATSPPSAAGAIIMVGSRGAFRGEPSAWAYGASKAAMASLAGSMAVCLGRYASCVPQLRLLRMNN
jgi:3-oxoacyl-[acyl-carrier protein] reductase